MYIEYTIAQNEIIEEQKDHVWPYIGERQQLRFLIDPSIQFVIVNEHFSAAITLFYLEYNRTVAIFICAHSLMKCARVQFIIIYVVAPARLAPARYVYVCVCA